MARPPLQPPREEIAPEELDSYDWVLARREGKPDRYYRAILVAPPIVEGLARLGRIFRTRGDFPGTYSHVDREWVDQVLCHDWGTNVVLAGHIPDALARGVRVEAIQALRAGRDDELTEDEQLLTRYIRAVARGAVTDEDWETMERRLGERGLVEFTAFVVYLMATIRFQQAIGLSELTNEEIDQMLAEFADGTRAIGEPRDIA